MRDDLHKGVALPRPWKKAVRACLRPADEGQRSRSFVSQALENELQGSVTKRGLDQIRRACESPSLPFQDNSGTVFGSKNVNELSVTERRLLELAKPRLERGDCATVAQAIRSSLADLAKERLSARKNQAETQLMKANPGQANEALAAMRKNFQADLPEVVDRILKTDGIDPVPSSSLKIDPDEDLR